MILNIVHAGDGSVIPPLKLYGLKISARTFNQITPVEFMKRDLDYAQCIPMGISLYRGGVPFQQNMFCEPRHAPLLADRTLVAVGMWHYERNAQSFVVIGTTVLFIDPVISFCRPGNIARNCMP